jgi:hypothetical protein
MHDPSSITRSRTQIIPICVIGAGSDEIGAAAHIGGYLESSADNFW